MSEVHIATSWTFEHMGRRPTLDTMEWLKEKKPSGLPKKAQAQQRSVFFTWIVGGILARKKGWRGGMVLPPGTSGREFDSHQCPFLLHYSALVV